MMTQRCDCGMSKPSLMLIVASSLPTRKSPFMSLQFDPSTGKITYRGKEVGEHISKDGRYIVRLTIEYKADDDWVVPLSWFAYGLSKLAENQPAQTLLTVETSDDSIDEEYEVVPVPYRKASEARELYMDVPQVRSRRLAVTFARA